MKKLLLAILIFLGLCTFTNAQDIHFSQYYASPLTLNPAMTGMVNGDFRVALNYRSQWFAVPTFSSISPYNTYQGSFDMPLFKRKLENSVFGIGAMFYADEAGNGSLTTMSGMGSISYHAGLDRFGRHRLGLGIQAGIVSKRIFDGDLLFENQFDNQLNTFNPLNWNGESFDNISLMYPDVNIGVLYTSQFNKKNGMYLGGSVNHVAQPTESFLGQDNKLERRFIAHGGAKLGAGKYAYIFPTFLFMTQGQAQQFNLGSGFEYELSEEFAFFAGGWARVAGGIDGFDIDAFIGNVGIEFYDVRIGASYDMTLSKFREANNSNGAFEISVIYIHNQTKPGDIDYNRFCPKF